MVQDSFLYCVTLFTFAVIFALCYIRYVFTFFDRNRIPGASTPTFPWGNVGDVVFKNTPLFVQVWKYHIRFKRRKCKFGGFYVFLKPAVAVVEPKLIQNSDHFENVNFSAGGFDLKPNSNVVDNMLDTFVESWARIIKETPNGDADVSQLLFRHAMDVAIINIFGSKKLPDPKFRVMIENLLGRNKTVFSNFTTLLPLYLPGLSKCFRSRKVYRDILETTTTNRKKNDIKRDDVIQILMESDLDTDRKVELVLTLVQNLENATNLILFCLYELSSNPEIQDDLRGEILRFKKQGSKLTVKELNRLSYLETVICETLRKFPAKPFICKVCKKDYTEGNFRVNQGTLLFVSTFGIHHDSDNYTNAEMFDPDRFSEENMKFVEPLKYLPNGCGSTDDFDFQYLRLVMKIGLIELLRKFKFSFGKKFKRTLKFDESCIGIRAKEGIWLNIEKI